MREMSKIPPIDKYSIARRYYTALGDTRREIDENARREIAFRLKTPLRAVNMRDTGNYFVLPGVTPSPRRRKSVRS